MRNAARRLLGLPELDPWEVNTERSDYEEQVLTPDKKREGTNTLLAENGLPHESQAVRLYPGLTNPRCYTFLLNMTTVTSRDLVHKSAEIRKLLAAGKTLRWTSHGVPVALIQPASPSEPKPKTDWISRARAAGAVNTSKSLVADSLYSDRD
jgi:antitoxin (DNA-binding transcriptional repressor) of toxin-antitoxin stability system